MIGEFKSAILYLFETHSTLHWGWMRPPLKPENQNSNRVIERINPNLLRANKKQQDEDQEYGTL